MLKNRFISLFLIVISLSCMAAHDVYGEKSLKVVTSTGFLADWVRQIGKEFVNVDSINDGRLDMHFFEPRPGHVLMCSRADVFVTAGLDLDVWMQPLLDASRNTRIQYNSKGYVDASSGVHALQKPQGRVDMSMGDIHPYGNPHYFYDLENVGIALENIVAGLSKADPTNEGTFKANKEAYWETVQTTFNTLKKLMEPFNDAKIITYHMSWEYFAREFGLEIVGYFEPKPGIPPSPKDIKNLIEIMNQYHVKVILKEPYFPKKYAEKVAQETGAKVLELTNLPGGRPDAAEYLENLKANVRDLLEVLGKVE